MKNLFLSLVLVCSASAWLVAQSNDTNDKSATRTITGCLQKTSHNNEYLLVGNDGSTWEVRSDAVALADHVGHEVAATGVVSNSTAHNMKEDTKEMAHDAGINKHDHEHGHMRITDLQMVSHSCSK
jgi:transcriptional antiterminator Rof (Rho-off)